MTAYVAQMNDKIEPVSLFVDQSDLDDLKDRLTRTRWPAAETVGDWSQGAPVGYVREVARYWLDTYDWRAFETKLNAAGQFRTEIDGVEIGFIHARSPHAHALPLLLTHGWPGSIREFTDLVEPLTNPEDPADAFHVVIPSLPGFGLSGQPHSTGWTVERIAQAWKVLMARLGYSRYGAHGGDWGSVVTSNLATVDADHMVGIHVTIPIVDLDPSATSLEGLSDFERAGAERVARFGASGMGYFYQQMTAPQTLGYGLADSPVGQLAWILDKFYNWTDCDGQPDNAISMDAMLDDVMLYWLNNAATSSARIYWESCPRMPEDVVGIPVGCSIFPFEHVRIPRARTEGRILDLKYWNELSGGGHFPGLEVPEVLTDELRKFFRLVR
ncbi:epoxide hydrolase [soil metagenome]